MWNTLKRLADWLDEILNPGNDNALLEFARVALDEALAQLAQAEIELADKAFYVREFAAVSVERDNLKAELAALRERPSVAPTDDQVEALARVLEDATAEGFEEEHKTYMRRLARVAIAHLAKRPEGLPTADQIKAAHLKYIESYRKGENDGSMCATDFALEYLAPYFRQPVEVNP